MKNISIQFLKNKKQIISGLPYYLGEFKINGVVKDQFMACVEWWTKKDYEQQWQEGLARLETYDRSCLVTNMIDPKVKSWIEVYNLYKINNQINIQASLIFGDTYHEKIGVKPFTLKTCYDYIQERFDDPNPEVDQWFVSIVDK